MESYQTYNDDFLNKQRQKGLPEEKLILYMKNLLSIEKIESLAELWEHKHLYPFINFEKLELLDNHQLYESILFIRMYADNYITRDDLQKKILRYINEQEEIKLNHSSFKNLLGEYLDENMLSYLSALSISFIGEHSHIPISNFEIQLPSTLDEIQKKVNEEISLYNPLFFSDKRIVSIDCYPKKEYINAPIYSITIDFKYLDVFLSHNRNELISIFKENELKLLHEIDSKRKVFEELQDIKILYRNSKDKNVAISQFLSFLNQFDMKDFTEIRDNFMSREELNQYIEENASMGPARLKSFLENYDCLSQDNYFYLNGEMNLEMIDDELFSMVCSDVEKLPYFEEIFGYEITRPYLKELSDEEANKLTKKCQDNYWLKVSGYAFTEEGYDENDYQYNFRSCPTRVDLYNIFSHGNWAIRDGFVYKDMAFIQQVNGGDEYWTLMKHGDQWVDYDSVTFHFAIERDEFYELLDDVHKLGLKNIEKIQSIDKIKQRGDRLET